VSAYSSSLPLFLHLCFYCNRCLLREGCGERVGKASHLRGATGCLGYYNPYNCCATEKISLLQSSYSSIKLVIDSCQHLRGLFRYSHHQSHQCSTRAMGGITCTRMAQPSTSKKKKQEFAVVGRAQQPPPSPLGEHCYNPSTAQSQQPRQKGPDMFGIFFIHHQELTTTGFPDANPETRAGHPGELHFSTEKPFWKSKMPPSPKVLKNEKQQTLGIQR